MEKARGFQKNIYFCFTDYAKAFDCVNHSKLWQVLIDLLRNLYVGQEANGYGTTDWFKIGKYDKAVCCLPTYLTYMQNTVFFTP